MIQISLLLGERASLVPSAFQAWQLMVGARRFGALIVLIFDEG